MQEKTVCETCIPKAMEMILSLTSLTFLLSFLFMSCFAFSNQTFQHEELPAGVAGPESFAFNSKGKGPYTGVHDGRIFKWHGATGGWKEFAVTAPSRNKDLCDGSIDPSLEPTCGRPLGLQFNQFTGDLYIGDAYFGLMKVGKNGGLAKQLASSAEGAPFRFINSLDIDQENGVVYFTDSSITYQRREVTMIVESGESTGRFMKYDPRTRQVTVLLRGLKFPNGVALGRENKYVLIAETMGFRILKYWLQGSRAKTTEVFISDLPDAPDNIKRNARGHFWVGLNNGGANPNTNDTIAVRLDRRGRVVEKLKGDGLLRSVSEVDEHKGTLFIGSVSMPYVALSTVIAGK